MSRPSRLPVRGKRAAAIKEMASPADTPFTEKYVGQPPAPLHAPPPPGPLFSCFLPALGAAPSYPRRTAMATIEFTYKGRRIWIDPYCAAQGWRVRIEVWEVGEQGVHKDDIRLPANYFFRSLRSARTFAERMTKRGIDRRQEQEETGATFTLSPAIH